MVSNVCKIEKGTKDLKAILLECEKFADLCGLDKKQTLQLRLICEEMDGMLPNIIDDFDGDFFIENEDNLFKVTATINIKELTAQRKEELINVSTNKKNACAVGVVGKIRSVIEDLFLEKCNMATLFNAGINYSVGLEPAYSWTLNNYKSAVKKENSREWDELEKSIIANLADDVVVGIKGKKANIVIIKKF